MAADFLPQSSLLIGIIPALALVYLVMRKWTEGFQEKIVFLLFVIGIISGTITIFVQYSILINLIYMIILYPVLEQLIKTMILNLPKFHGKQETVLYGLVFGLGFGSIYPPVSLLLIGAEQVTSFEVISILIGSIGLILLHGATGAMIGHGVYIHKLFQMFLISVIILIVANLLKFPFIQWTTFVFGFIVYWFMLQRFLYPALEQSKQRKTTKKV